MGRRELRGRATWQDYSGAKAGVAEKSFIDVMTEEFRDSTFRVRPKPREFKNIYSRIRLPAKIRAAIYSPNETWTHGVIPDFAVDNTATNKTLYVEVKRQDGWVEGKERKAGRGNAHERSCKFFTPGLLSTLRQRGKLGEDVLPFWVVFQGDIARDPKRVREIWHWYLGYRDHFFLWTDSTDSISLASHFNRKLRHLLL